MPKAINDSAAERHQDNLPVSASPSNGGDRHFPASREAWADVLATATKYY